MSLEAGRQVGQGSLFVMRDRRFWFLVILSLVAASSRLAPRPMNFAPMTALALFGAATFTSRRVAVVAPLLTLLLSDALLQWTHSLGWQPHVGFYSGQGIVYACMLLTVGIGFLVRGRTNVPTIAAATLAGSLVFFLVTNFPWPLGPVRSYPTTPAGAMASYTAGLPFFRNTVLGDAVYSTLLFGSLALAEVRFPSLRRTRPAPAAIAA